MEDTQTRKLNMGLTTVSGLNSDNFDPIVSGNALATTKRTELEQIIEDIEAADVIQQATSSGGESLTKEEFKHILSEQAEIIAQGLCGYALEHNNHILYQQMNYHAAHIFKLKDTECKDFCSLVLQNANIDPAGLLPYNVTALMLAAFPGHIQDFETAENAPQTAQGLHHTATQNVAAGLTEMMKILLWFDHWVATFRYTNHDFYSAYHSWRRVLNTGVRHVSVRGLVKSSVGDLLLPKVKVSVLETGSIAHTGQKGKFNIMSLETGVFTLMFELPGYQKITLPIITVTKGTITEVATVTLIKN